MRSNELETGLSSSNDPMEVEVDTAISNLREVRPFSALGEECSLDIETLSRFSQRFQFPERVRVRLPRAEEQAYHFTPGEVCFYEATFLCGLRFPVHPFIMEFLNHFNITPGQLYAKLMKHFHGAFSPSFSLESLDRTLTFSPNQKVLSTS